MQRMNEKLILVVTTLLVVILIVLVIGCTQPPLSPTRYDVSTPRIIWTKPADGDTDVALDTKFVLVFDRPMDVHSVESNYRIYKGVKTVGEGLEGDFRWSTSADTVVFVPANMLVPHTGYTMHLAIGMMNQHGGQSMGHCDMSSDHSEMMDEEMEWYCTTGE